MSVDLELLTVARNYAVKVEAEFKQAQRKWTARFQDLDDELQSLYSERDVLNKKFYELQQELHKKEMADGK